jgi:hypothetical protein
LPDVARHLIAFESVRDLRIEAVPVFVGMFPDIVVDLRPETTHVLYKLATHKFVNSKESLLPMVVVARDWDAHVATKSPLVSLARCVVACAAAAKHAPRIAIISENPTSLAYALQVPPNALITPQCASQSSADACCAGV